MTTYAVPAPLPPWLDLDGSPLDKGELYFGVTAQNPETTPIAVYWDSAKTQPASLPIKTRNGYAVHNGAPSAIYIDGDYSISVKNKRGALVVSLASNLLLNPVAVFQQALAAGDGSLGVGWTQIGAGAVLRPVQDKLRAGTVEPADYGAVADDTADDTTPLQKVLLNATGGRIARLERGKTYRIASDELVMQDFSHLDGNGATLHFTHANVNKRCLAVGSGCTVENLTITNTSGVLGSNGTNQTPVVVGSYTSTSVVSRVTLRNLTISSLSPGGNGIAILGAEDFTVENITFPDSANLAIAILCHWSFDGGVTTPYTGITKHPRNGRISNIRAGTFSYAAGSWKSIVFLSACYNVDVSNVYTDNIVHGKIVTVYAGDWGYQFGTTVEQTMGYCGINVRNVYGQCLMGVHVYGRDDGSQAVTQVWPGSVSVNNMSVYGITGDTASMGLRLEDCDHVTATNCIVDSFYTGMYLGAGVTNCRIEYSRIRQSVTFGINGSDLTAGSGAISILYNEFLGTNTGAGSNHGDIVIDNATGLTIDHNTFNSSNATWSFRCENTCSRVRITYNHTYNVSAAGPAYSIGASTDKDICSLFDGNTCDDAPTNGFRGGQIYLPAIVSTTASGTSNAKPRIFYGPPGDPAAGTGNWVVGDIILNDSIAAGGRPARSCITAGDPGTWKAWAAVDA